MASRTPPCPTSEGAALPSGRHRGACRATDTSPPPFARGVGRPRWFARPAAATMLSSRRSAVRPCTRSTPLRCVLIARARYWRPWGAAVAIPLAIAPAASPCDRWRPQWCARPRSGRRGASQCARPAGLALPPSPQCVEHTQRHPRPARVPQRQDSRRPPHQSAATATNLSEGGRG